MLSLVMLMLAIVRFAFFEFVSDRMDYTFLALVAAAALIPLIPWERVRTVKFGPVEFTLSEAQVQGAIEGIDFRTIDDFGKIEIQELLMGLADEIIRSRGSRILWIDDNPHRIIGERRLLRALGVEVTTARSSAIANEILQADNDFDLIITDIDRYADSHSDSPTPGPTDREGVNYAIKLRKSEDAIISGMSILFYASFLWERLREITMDAFVVPPAPHLSNSIDGLLTEVFRILAHVRSDPIKVEWYKKPSGAEEMAFD